MKGRRIMLVEDNELNREIAYELLSESGLIVDVAENGHDAIKLLGTRPENYYELIFMDIQMPVMNGYEATANIRAGGERLLEKYSGDRHDRKCVPGG